MKEKFLAILLNIDAVVCKTNRLLPYLLDFQWDMIQLKEYKKDPLLLQLSKTLTTNSLLI